MRSVAAPNLFSNEESVERIITQANELEHFRLRNIEETASVRGGDFSGVVRTDIKSLMSQKVFVLVGNEDGISGLESFNSKLPSNLPSRRHGTARTGRVPRAEDARRSSRHIYLPMKNGLIRSPKSSTTCKGCGASRTTT